MTLNSEFVQFIDAFQDPFLFKCKSNWIIYLIFPSCKGVQTIIVCSFTLLVSTSMTLKVWKMDSSGGRGGGI